MHSTRAERLGHLGLAAPLLVDVALQRLGDLLLAGVDRTLGHLEEDGLEAGARRDLCDAAPHLTASDHRDATNFHLTLLLVDVLASDVLALRAAGGQPRHRQTLLRRAAVATAAAMQGATPLSSGSGRTRSGAGSST